MNNDFNTETQDNNGFGNDSENDFEEPNDNQSGIENDMGGDTNTTQDSDDDKLIDVFNQLSPSAKKATLKYAQSFIEQ